MSDYLNRKIIRTTKTAEGLKKYTVKQLRSEVRQLIKESNKILYDLSESKKAEYMKQISADIQSNIGIASKRQEGTFSQMRVKYMTSKELTTAYNALTAFVAADKESAEYAKRLAGREDRMRRKAEKTLGKSISKKAYKKMMDMWSKYSDKVDMYGYNALIDYAKKTSRKKEPIADALDRGENVLKSKGIAPTPGQVLKYLSNEDAVENAVKKYEAAGLTPQEAYEKAIQELTKQ